MQNGAFSKTLPNLQLYWDSTSLGYLKTCPRLYQLSMTALEPGVGFQARASNIHLLFGQVYHGALERYDHAKCDGKSHHEAEVMAVRWALQSTWKDGRPWDSDDKNKNRMTLIRTIVWYLDHFEEDSLETIVLENGKPAVELSFRYETDIKSVDGENFILCGHIDRLVKFYEKIYVSDRKTTKSTLGEHYFASFSPHNQFSGYTLAGKIVFKTPVSGLIVDAAQVGVNFSRFERQIIPRDEEQLIEWYNDLFYWLHEAERYARNNYWPMNDTSCDKFGGCVFRSVCSKSPRVRDLWLKSAFVQRLWDPTQSRGDI